MPHHPATHVASDGSMADAAARGRPARITKRSQLRGRTGEGGAAGERRR